MKVGSEYYFYHNDHLGTPQKLTTVSGAVVWSAKYSSFGKAKIDPASTVTNNLRMAGQYEDGETILFYNRLRYYQPNTGRYLRTDPIGLDGGINVYAYVYSNPIELIDPFGLTPETFCCKGKYVSTDPNCCKGSSVNDSAGAWAQYVYNHPNEMNAQFYMHDLNADNNRTDGYWRCNTFVWDSYTKGGKIPKKRIPINQKSGWAAYANDLADPKFRPDILDIVKGDSNLKTGDIVAWPRSDDSGHVGIIGCDGKIYNARRDKIERANVAFGTNDLYYWYKNRSPVYRRPKF